MAADQEFPLADDGVQEVRLTDARSALTQLIEQLREQGLISALTVRGKRRAVLVTPEFYKQALTALAAAEQPGGHADR
ncbi:MAG: hypothetical protein ACRDQ1_05170 [Sciscionella sp.]